MKKKIATRPLSGFDELDAAGIGAGYRAFEEEQPVAEAPKEKSTSLGDYSNAAGSGVLKGIAGTATGIGTFAQAPAANTLSGVLGARALVDRGVTGVRNWINPGSSALDEDVQSNARMASQFAAEERAKNSADGGIAGAAKSVEGFGRASTQALKDFDENYNPELIKQEKNVSDAKGFWGTAKATLSNPLALTGSLAQSAPDMALGVGVGSLAARSRMALGLGAVEKAGAAAAKTVAASGGDLVAQGVAANAARDAAAQALQKSATHVAGSVGVVSESASSAYGGREGTYQQVMGMPEQTLLKTPRYNAILAATGDPAKARMQFANEIADQAPMLTALGTALGSMAITKITGHDLTAELAAGAKKTTAKDIAVNALGHEGPEEVLQGIPEDLVQHGAMVQADPDHELDLGGGIAQNYIAGAVMGAGGTGASYVKDKFGKQAPVDPAAAAAKLLADQQEAARKAAVGAAHAAALTPNSPISRAAAAANPLTPEEAWAKAQELDAQAALDEANGVTPVIQAPVDVGGSVGDGQGGVNEPAPIDNDPTIKDSLTIQPAFNVQAAQEQYRAETLAAQQAQDDELNAQAEAALAKMAQRKQQTRPVNEVVSDGGYLYEGTQDGDVLNGLGKPFSIKMGALQEAKRQARENGGNWTVAPVFDGYVARKKEASNVGVQDGTEPRSAEPDELAGDNANAGMGDRPVDRLPEGDNPLGADADPLGQSGEQAGGSDAGAVTPEKQAITDGYALDKTRDSGVRIFRKTDDAGRHMRAINAEGELITSTSNFGEFTISDSYLDYDGPQAFVVSMDNKRGHLTAKNKESGQLIELSPRADKEFADGIPLAKVLETEFSDAGGIKPDGSKTLHTTTVKKSAPTAKQKSNVTTPDAQAQAVGADSNAAEPDQPAAAPQAAPTQAVGSPAASTGDVPGAGSAPVESVGVSLGERAIREQASVATSGYDTEKKLRFADFAESLAGQSKEAIQKAIVNSEFGTGLAVNELDGVSKSIAESASLVAGQARKNAAPKAESTPAQKLENQIKFQKLRLEQASDAIRSATDTDRFGLPVENGPKKQSAIKRHADAQQKLSELERELSEIGKQDASAANRAKLKAKNTPNAQAQAVGADTNAAEPDQPAAEPAGASPSEVDLTTVDGVARAVQLKVAANRRKSREKSRKEREAKGYAPNSTPESEQADYEAEISAPPSDMQKQSAAAMLGTDPLPLIRMFVNGKFEASEDVFKALTGVKIRGLSAAAKKAALYQWAGWTPEQIAQAEGDVQARKDEAAEKYRQDDLKSAVMGAWLGLDRLKVKEKDGAITTGQDFVLKAVASGFDKAHSQKRGAAVIYGLTDGARFTTLKAPQFTAFVKSAIAYGGLDKALAYVNPPKPQAPEGFVDRSIDIGGVKDDGMTAKAFSKPDAQLPVEDAAPAPQVDAPSAEPVPRPKNWENNYGAASKIAEGLNIALRGANGKMKKVPELVAEIKALDVHNSGMEKLAADWAAQDASKNPEKVDTSAEPVQKPAESEQATPNPVSERKSRIASALDNGGHVVGSELRDRNGLRLLILTPEELADMPGDKIRTKPDANMARTQSSASEPVDAPQIEWTRTRNVDRMGIALKAGFKESVAESLSKRAWSSLDVVVQEKLAGAMAEQAAPSSDPAERVSTTHAGLKIYPVRVNIGGDPADRWGVQTLNNAEREKNGERQIGGDPLAETLEQAKELAEQEVATAKTLEKHREELQRVEQEKSNKDAAEKTAFDESPVGRFIAASDYTPMRKGAATLALKKLISFKGESVETHQFIESLVADGYAPILETENRVADKSSREWNRMDNRQQAAHERKVKEGGTVEMAYMVKGDSQYSIGKTEYAYAKHQQGLEPVATDAPMGVVDAAEQKPDAANKPADTPSQEPSNTIKSSPSEDAAIEAKTTIEQLDAQIKRHEELLGCLG